MLEFFGKSYFGEYECAVDAQRRISLPSDWRRLDQRDNGFVLFPGRYGSLALVPAEMVDDLVASLRKLSFANPDAFLPLANIGARAQVCQCDKQGRFVVNANLLEDAAIDGKALLVGAVTFVQIWQPESWKRLRSDNDKGLDVVQMIQESNTDLGSLLKNLGRAN